MSGLGYQWHGDEVAVPVRIHRRLLEQVAAASLAQGVAVTRLRLVQAVLEWSTARVQPELPEPTEESVAAVRLLFPEEEA